MTTACGAAMNSLDTVNNDTAQVIPVLSTNNQFYAAAVDAQGNLNIARFPLKLYRCQGPKGYKGFFALDLSKQVRVGDDVGLRPTDDAASPGSSKSEKTMMYVIYAIIGIALASLLFYMISRSAK